MVDARRALKAGRVPTSRDSPVDADSDALFGDFIEGRAADSPVQAASRNMLKARVGRALHYGVSLARRSPQLPLASPADSISRAHADPTRHVWSTVLTSAARPFGSRGLWMKPAKPSVSKRLRTSRSSYPLGKGTCASARIRRIYPKACAPFI